MKAIVLAGGYPQIELIKELKRREIYVLLVDYYENPIAKPYADEFYQISTLDVEAVMNLAKAQSVDFLITACTDQALLTVAKVSEELKLPCYIDYKTALNVTNKTYMKSIFEKEKIPTAKHVALLELAEKDVIHMNYPLIVKPADCNSSKGVKKVMNWSELKNAFSEAVSLSRTKTAIVEEFVEGQEISVDIQVKNGKAHILGMSYSDKIKDNEKFVIFRARYPICENDEIKKQIEEIAQKIANAFGLKDSLMLIQLISNGKNVFVLEFSARTGGGIKYQLIKKVSGVDVIKSVVDLTLGIDSKIQIETPESRYINNVFIYCYPGVFDRLEGFEELKTSGVISNYCLFKNSGTVMTGVSNSGDRIASFTIQAETEEELNMKYRSVEKKIKVLDVEGKDIMRHDLIDIPRK